MNKAELIQQLEAQFDSKKEAADALNAVIDTITRAVAKGEKVSITGFGTFEKVTRAARKGRNPRTGETVPIKRTNVPKFRPGASFKAYVASPKTLPKLEKPVKKTAATKAAATKTATKATAKKTTVKAAPKKAAVKKTATKKTTAKAAPKKATATKAAPKKVTAKKTAPKKAAKKTTGKKASKKG